MGEQSTAVHTPGPWVFIDATKVAAMRYAPTCVIQAGNKQVASFSWNDNSPHFPSKSESQANARLIAAAPEMLSIHQDSVEILQAVLEEREALTGEDEVLRDLIRRIGTVIAKATGGAA